LEISGTPAQDAHNVPPAAGTPKWARELSARSPISVNLILCENWQNMAF